MYKCPSCKIDHLDGVCCSNCNAHQCFTCANISEKNYRKLGTAKKATMLCLACKPRSETPKSGNSSLAEPAVPSSATLDLVLKELRDGISGINGRLEQLPTLIQEVHDIKEKFNHFQDAVNVKTASMESRISSLEASACSDDYLLLQNKVSYLTAELASREQRGRINNVEIRGIPIKKNENLIALVCKLAETVKQPVAPSDINFITRARATTGTKPIIVGFLGRYVKDNLVAAARTYKNLTAEELGFPGVASRVFVNDHLTRENKQLLTKTKKEALEKNYRFVWVQNCRILARKGDTSPIIYIQNEDDLKKIK